MDITYQGQVVSITKCLIKVLPDVTSDTGLVLRHGEYVCKVWGGGTPCCMAVTTMTSQCGMMCSDNWDGRFHHQDII